jgi:glyoxylase-like metal-dependent hydrolase (beta-lactamase superfamily II)
LHVIQAAFGDCLLLEYGAHLKRYILVDGGPPDTFRFHLHPILTQITNSGGIIDLVVLSHVDADHITGLLEYFTELRTVNHGLPVPPGLWHNTFTATIDPNGVIHPRLAGLITPSRANTMSVSGSAVQGIREGVPDSRAI